MSENKDETPTTPADGEDISDPCIDVKNELEEQKKQNLYLRADFENYRKQMIKERSELIKFGSEPLIREFLNVYDDLERAASTDLTVDSMDRYKDGVLMILAQFKKALEKFGIQEMESHGQPFDPAIHEALSSEQNADLPPNTVSQVFKKGFKLHGKVIRPAQVVVSTGKPKEQG